MQINQSVAMAGGVFGNAIQKATGVSSIGQDDTPIAAEIKQLHGAIATAQSGLNVIRQKLAPVLSPPSRLAKTQDSIDFPPGMCDMEVQLRTAIRLIEEITTDLLDLRDDLRI